MVAIASSLRPERWVCGEKRASERGLANRSIEFLKSSRRFTSSKQTSWSSSSLVSSFQSEPQSESELAVGSGNYVVVVAVVGLRQSNAARRLSLAGGWDLHGAIRYRWNLPAMVDKRCCGDSANFSASPRQLIGRLRCGLVGLEQKNKQIRWQPTKRPAGREGPK